MNNNVFRKKSIERIQSPEALNDYIRVSDPGVWLLLAAIIALLAGAVVWGAFGHVDTSVRVAATVEGGQVSCAVTEEQAGSIAVGAPVTVGSEQGSVSAVYETGGSFRVLVEGISLPDGSFDASIVTESIAPLSLLFQ